MSVLAVGGGWLAVEDGLGCGVKLVKGNPRRQKVKKVGGYLSPQCELGT